MFARQLLIVGNVERRLIINLKIVALDSNQLHVYSTLAGKIQNKICKKVFSILSGKYNLFFMFFTRNCDFVVTLIVHKKK